MDSRKQAAIVAAAVAVLGAGAGVATRPGAPAVVLWAWERAEDLRFLQPGEASVAFLAETVVLEGSAVAVRPRLQPLRVSPGTPLIAVARIEHGASPRLTDGQRSAAAIAIARIATPAVAAVQVDFDAVASEKVFYAELLRELRTDLPRNVPLSITALASWCTSETWMSGLPVDEAVPMLFRMGPDRAAVLRNIDSLKPGLCRETVGISTDEPVPRLPGRRRVYIFHPRPWSAGSARLAIAQVKSWR